MNNKLLIMWKYLFYDKFANDHNYHNPITKNITTDEVINGEYYEYTGLDAIKFFNTKFVNVSTISHIPQDLLNTDIYRVSVYVKTIGKVDVILTVIGIDVSTLCHLVLNQKPIPFNAFLDDLCRFDHIYTNATKSKENTFYKIKDNSDIISGNVNFINQKALTAVDYTFDPMIPDPQEIMEKLYQYQKCSVHWMINKEKNIKKIYYALGDIVKLGEIYYDLNYRKFFHMSERKYLEFYGGGLIDEVGLGKTLQIITLSLLNSNETVSYTKPENKSKMFSRATLVICPNQLCGQWVREIKKMVSSKYDPQVVILMTKKHHDKYTYQDLLDADFVIVSYTFLDNKSFTSPWMGKLSSSLSFHRNKWTGIDKIKVKNLFELEGEYIVKNGFETLKKTNPLLQYIHWQRLAVDEFHEIHTSKYNYISNILPYISSNYKWCISATPFMDDNSLYNCVDFLTAYRNTDDKNILKNTDIVEYLSTDCFRRNSKDSVKQEHTLPPIQEEIRWLKFSPTERMMYNAYLANPDNDKYSKYLRQLCCHPQLADETKHVLSNCKTLQDIERMMIAHYKHEVDIAQGKIDKVLERITKIEEKIAEIEDKKKKRQQDKLDKLNVDMADIISILAMENDGIGGGTITLDGLKDTIVKLNERVVVLRKEYDGKLTTYNFFSNVVARIRKTVTKTSNTTVEVIQENPNGDSNVMNMLASQLNDKDDEDEESCGICMDEIPENDVGVTKCGHMFCYGCLKIAVSRYHNCPMCCNKLEDTDIFMLSYEKPKTKKLNKEDISKNALIDEVGTKLANLILYLKETDKHTIIFSQWDDLLRKVGVILLKHKIKNVFCKGNCYQRDKAIREFNDDTNMKVIMLSSESAASGTNLTKASEVILIDPIYGNYEYRKGQERQAIGRAHRLGQKNQIKLVRFLVKDSIEDEIHMTNIQDDIKYNLANNYIQKSENVVIED